MERWHDWSRWPRRWRASKLIPDVSGGRVNRTCLWTRVHREGKGGTGDIARILGRHLVVSVDRGETRRSGTEGEKPEVYVVFLVSCVLASSHALYVKLADAEYEEKDAQASKHHPVLGIHGQEAFQRCSLGKNHELLHKGLCIFVNKTKSAASSSCVTPGDGFDAFFSS